MAKTKVDGASARSPRPSRTPPQAKASPPPESSSHQVGHKVRVWWPPTREKKKTDFSGMYWPVKVLEIVPTGLRVEYDNGEEEIVDLENVHPLKPPVDFGEEQIPYQVGEFVEVFNASESDPAAWLGRIAAEHRDSYTVEYPFHDSPSEKIKPALLRRARIFEKETQLWKIIKPHQEWNDGEVESPLELETIDGKELAKLLQRGSAGQMSSITRPSKVQKVTQATASTNKRKGGRPERARV